MIAKKKGQNEMITDIVIVDGYKFILNGKMMDHCDENQFILPLHQIHLVWLWNKTKSTSFFLLLMKEQNLKCIQSTDINKECFMNILADLWNNWSKSERIMKAAKRLGISKDGLSIKWMDQDKFEQAEAILNPSTPTKTVQAEYQVKSPKGMTKCNTGLFFAD